jgi:hypothetical protein
MQRNWIAALCCLIVLAGCGSRHDGHEGQGANAPEKSPFSNNLSGNAIIFPLQTIPRRNQRRYINHDGGEAIVYYYAGKAHILTRATERFGDFQLVPYASVEDPVVLPLASGQVFVASTDRVLIRDVCPDPMCSFSEFLSTPTPEKPLAFDQDSAVQGRNASNVFMVNGTQWLYSYDLLQRNWRQVGQLPEGTQAIAVKRLGTHTLVLDRTGSQVWVDSGAGNRWRRFPVPAQPNDPVKQIAVVGDALVLSNNAALWVTNTRSILSDPNAASSPKAKPAVAWKKIAALGKAQLVQISSDSNYLYCTTDSGDIFRIQGHELANSSSPPLWLNFEPSLSLPVEHEPILRLRWINGELLAFSADGISHSRNLGVSWVREPRIANQLVRTDEISLGGNLYVVTRASLLMATPEEANRQQWRTVKELASGCVVGSVDDNAPESAPALEPVSAHSIAIVSMAPGNASQGVCIFDNRAGTLKELFAGAQPSRIPLSLLSVGNNLILGSEHGLNFWDPAKQRWTSTRETAPFDGSFPNGGVTAVARYGDRGVILATESRALYTRDAWDSAHPWKRLGDKYDSVMNLVNGNTKITSIWVNPGRLSEMYLVLNQLSAISLYYRDRADSMFVVNPVGGDRATGLVASDTAEFLWIVGVNNSYYINRNRPPIGSLDDVVQRFQDRAGAKLSEPITWIVGLLSTYAIAVLCVLAFRFLPVSPVLGRSWLASQIVKPFTVSPILGRWILFLGYRAKLRKEMLAQGFYFGLPATLPDGTSVPADRDGQTLCDSLLKQAEKNPSLLVTGRPGSGKSMLLTRLAYTSVTRSSGRKKLLPILITADVYSGDLIESASKLLKERYGIPLDKEDILVGQMQVGGILFLFDGLSEVSISRGSAVADILRVTRMPEFKQCSLIISSRFFDGLPNISTCQIFPVRATDAIDLYLPHFSLPPEEQQRAKTSLLTFHDQPVDVQLLMMSVEARGKSSFQSRYEIFRAFFQKRLSAEDADGAERWAGWTFALEQFARWFCLEAGVKSLGLSQRATVDTMNTVVSTDEGRGASRNLVSELRDSYNVEMTNEVSLLNYLRMSGLLIRLDRWKFAHDSFEEFFCASYLARIAGRERILDHLALWLSRPEELTEVFSFLAEMLDEESRVAICTKENVPVIWRNQLLPASVASESIGSSQ